MFVAGLGHHLLDIERLAVTGIELADPYLDLGAQPAQRIETFEQLAPEQFLCRLGKLTSLGDREFECFHHKQIIAENHPVDEFCNRGGKLAGGSERGQPYGAGASGFSAWITRAVSMHPSQYETSASVFRAIQRNTACASPGDN